MSVDDYTRLTQRLKKSALQSLESALKILNGDGIADSHALRSAASQCDQAAKELNQLDGVLQAIDYLRMK
jgi:hypothetical protein